MQLAHRRCFHFLFENRQVRELDSHPLPLWTLSSVDRRRYTRLTTICAAKVVCWPILSANEPERKFCSGNKIPCKLGLIQSYGKKSFSLPPKGDFPPPPPSGLIFNWKDQKCIYLSWKLLDLCVARMTRQKLYGGPVQRPIGLKLKIVSYLVLDLYSELNTF